MVKEINKINERELDLDTKGSWHDDYKGVLCASYRVRNVKPGYTDSAYIFAGGLNTELTEGDVITIFSQYVSTIPCSYSPKLSVPGMVRSWT